MNLSTELNRRIFVFNSIFLSVMLQAEKELKKLNELLAQRDTEINILVNLLKKERARIKGPETEKPTSPTSIKTHSNAQRSVKILSKVN